MNPLIPISAYALLAAMVASGFVWYGCALADNVRVLRQNMVLRAAAVGEVDAESETEKSDEAKSTEDKDKS